MSLQVWLPLNGTTENKGLANVGITSNGITYQNGKIGKAASFSNGYVGIDGTPITGELSEFSICFWVKFDRVDTIMAFYNGRDAISGPVSIFLINGHFRFDDGAMHDFPFQPSANTWYHICFTRNAATITMYVNGALSGTKKAVAGTVVTTKATIGQSQGNGANQLFGLLNDYRIYNHCLSQKEVREISKGLCLHYRLSGHGGENLLKQSSMVGEKLVCNSAEMMNSVTTFEYSDEGCHIVTPNDSGNQNNGVGFVYNDFTTLGISPGDTITFSFDVKGTTDNNSPRAEIILLWNGITWWTGAVTSPATWFYPKKDKWMRIGVTLTVPEGTPKSYRMRLAIHGNMQSDLYIKNLKLEIGNKVTRWLPNPSDALYSALGYADGTEPDCTGFGYDGTKNGEFSCDSDTPRYTTCYQISDKKMITAKVGAAPTPTDAITIAVWVKISDYPTVERDVICNFDAGGCGIYVNGSNVYFDIYSGGYKRMPAPIAKGIWQHVVGTYDGQMLKIYINGAPKNTLNFTGQITYHSATPWCVGANPNYSSTGTTYIGHFTGKVSDARVYATALSAADVLDLYQTSASVDDGGNVHAYELLEDKNMSICKTGTTKTGAYLETDVGNAFLGPNSVSAAEFVEI